MGQSSWDSFAREKEGESEAAELEAEAARGDCGDCAGKALLPCPIFTPLSKYGIPSTQRTESTTNGAQVALIAILAAMRWGMQRWPGRGQLPDGFYDEDFLYSLQSKSSRLELPEGQSCDIHDDKGDLTCVPHTTWQQLMSAKARPMHIAHSS